ncbi:TetR/AcrR family transcriptional regulator [Streptomyces sp. NBC_01619]|uniref:TetR/AcrR family transcriptional regulator n=1 Tax=Streptomyces sp. NBC_01619 TaxID=2975901 RepID=UPI002259A625|nr:TetR/AcrR family transcriptional regulator [Streptomyces sp. NBC_01619]MCX4515417.1 TetR/AcrR family transcriptional regulator [Streptomyces sp. NBC_01619]
MNRPATPPTGLRERKKAQTRRTIQEQALRLFLSQGYDNTTVDEIARAAGVSSMTFFRHFPTKESVVESDDYDPLIVALIEQRPPEETPLAALHHALGEGLAAVYATDRDALLVRTRLILRTPALRARLWENQHATEQMLTKALAARSGQEPDLPLRVIAAAALAALTATLAIWVEGDGEAHLPELVDEAFTTLDR